MKVEAVDTDAKRICDALGKGRYPLSQEKVTQAAISLWLTECGIYSEREVILGAGDIVDFMVGGVAIEVKLRGAQKMAVYKQLCRYAKYPVVKAIVLVTNLSMGLPDEIEGKPAYYVSLGRSWI